ncbi:glycosyltransferase [Candidatus Frankia meridionalis]|uniref:Glycosyl transferase group 1 n=1 Tax=Candidatus Protofrankia datiscae TaxID=2716812 RepID=F8AYP6_9ACTN|nr:glycosyl transferase group 1 [Candidatus Protofrankia datiscae]
MTTGPTTSSATGPARTRAPLAVAGPAGGVRAAVYNRFWHSMGGGERHNGMIAEALASEGAEVDLLGHSAVDLDALGAHLGLDLSGCRYRLLPDRGDDAVAEISAEYDLFVNGSYMSRLIPRSKHAAYLCFFPTPADHDAAAWRRAAIRAGSPFLRGVRPAVGYGTGWYPPEGGRRRQWVWSNGAGILSVAPGGERVLHADVGRPGAPGTVRLRVLDAAGQALADIEVGTVFTSISVPLPASSTGTELTLVSETFTPAAAGAPGAPDVPGISDTPDRSDAPDAPDDTSDAASPPNGTSQADGTGRPAGGAAASRDIRQLGVALSRPRVTDRREGVRARVALRFPWLLTDPRDLGYLDAYDVVMANSAYTRDWIRRLWRTDADLLYPPIQVARLAPAEERERSVLSVGRLFAPGLGHAKRQLEMVRWFGELYRSGALPGWRMHVVGGCEDSQLPYLEQIRDAARGLPVEIHPNAPRHEVERLLSTCSVFWSATGYGEDVDRRPWTAEHFGMTTVEAMAGGCVPVVIDSAGQREIVRHGLDGFRWTSPQQLASFSRRLATEDGMRRRLAASAIARAQEYSDTAFATRWRDTATRHHLYSKSRQVEGNHFQ